MRHYAITPRWAAHLVKGKISVILSEYYKAARRKTNQNVRENLELWRLGLFGRESYFIVVATLILIVVFSVA